MTAPDPRLEEIEGRYQVPWLVSECSPESPASVYEEADGLETICNIPGYYSPEAQNYIARQIAAAPADIAYLLAELRKAHAALGKVEALAEKWRYKGEYGYGAWQEGYGPDHEGYLLDNVSGELRAAVAVADAPAAADADPWDTAYWVARKAADAYYKEHPEIFARIHDLAKAQEPLALELLDAMIKPEAPK